MRIYNHLFKTGNPEAGGDDFIQHLNPSSIEIISSAKLEPGLKQAKNGIPYQFLRNGYFCLDVDSITKKLIFNRTVGLRENWAKK